MENSREKARVVATNGMRSIAMKGMTLSRRVDAACWRYRFLLASCPIESFFSADELKYIFFSCQSIEVETLIFSEPEDQRNMITLRLRSELEYTSMFQAVSQKLLILSDLQVIVLIEWLEAKILNLKRSGGVDV